tara:strand:+ start:4531 stop:5415 length:885 start_codon:yes stop_codon:yes gene_type:complete
MKRKKTRIVELVISDDSEELTIDAISLVTSPAIEEDFVFFGKEKNNLTLAKVDEEKRMLVSPALIPNKQIYRYDAASDTDYYVYFSKETVRQASELYLKHNNHHKATYEHEDRVSGVLTIESWIKEGDKDKSSYYGFDLPSGTWFVKMRIDNDELWEEIKKGSVRGLSIEGYFVDKMQSMAKQQPSDEEVLIALADLLELKAYTDYPKGASTNAEKALIENEQNGNYATYTSVKIARMLAIKKPISLKTVKKIYSYLKSTNKEKNSLAYNLFGGEVMFRWCDKTLKAISGAVKY